MEIGCFAQSVDNFECRRFLSFKPIVVDRVDDGYSRFGGKFAYQGEASIEVAFEGDHDGSINERLRKFAHCDLAGGKKDGALNSRPCRVGGRRSRSVAGRCADNQMGAPFDRLAHRDRHPAIFERTGWIEALKLEVDATIAANN